MSHRVNDYWPGLVSGFTAKTPEPPHTHTHKY